MKEPTSAEVLDFECLNRIARDLLSTTDPLVEEIWTDAIMAAEYSEAYDSIEEANARKLAILAAARRILAALDSNAVGRPYTVAKRTAAWRWYARRGLFDVIKPETDQ